MLSPSARMHLAKILLLIFLCATTAIPQNKPDDVLRINTSLGQTDVLVLDKNGRFVDDLKPQEIELRVDGRVRPLAFFDHVVAGSASEEEKLAAARGTRSNTAGAPIISFDRGRTILFFVDDYHLSANSLNRTRELLTSFVTTQMKPEDQAAIITASGQLGFLEQLVKDQFVLNRAISKLAHRNFQTTDAERTPMSEADAAAIVQDDRRVLDLFVDQLLKEMGRLPRGVSPRGMKTRLDAESMVKARAKSMIDQSTSLAAATLTAFERLIRLTGDLPWRKTVFFISDGFTVYDRSNPTLDVQRITAAAARGTSVIYSVDARGLATSITEASRKLAFDNGRNVNTNTSAITSPQELLRTLAVDTGGRAILNTNAPAEETDQALKENATYYLLSWKLDEKDVATNSAERIEVTLRDRPDLIVRVRNAYSRDVPGPRASTKPAKKKDEDPLANAMQSLAPRIDLPVFLSVGYRRGEQNMVLTSTIEVPVAALEANASPNSAVHQLDLMAAAVDINGKLVTVFDQALNVNPTEIRARKSESALYSHEIGLAPGLYQIRVAVRDRAANRIGSAAEWIEIPKSQNESLSTSSLFVGAVDALALESGKLSVNAAHRFRSGSSLGFFLIIDNARAGAAGPDVVLQIQMLRDDQPVVTKPLVNVTPSATVASIPYGEDLPLEGLPAGKYLLQVTAIDRIAKTSARQQARFVIY